MVFFEKSQPAPECLAREKLKKSGDYKCGDVLPRLQEDFRNKCYLCEAKGIQTINVEHFVPHKNTDVNLKFGWDNLFWACGHCNNVKLASYVGILDCTKIDVEEKIQFHFKPFPLEKPVIAPLDKDAATLLTCKLLDNIYNGTTTLKKIEAGNLRDSLLGEIVDFQQELINYFKFKQNPTLQATSEVNIRFHLSKSLAFTAFKRQIIRNNEGMKLLFEKHFD